MPHLRDAGIEQLRLVDLDFWLQRSVALRVVHAWRAPAEPTLSVLDGVDRQAEAAQL